MAVSVFFLVLSALEYCQATSHAGSEAEFTSRGNLMAVKAHRLLRQESIDSDGIEQKRRGPYDYMDSWQRSNHDFHGAPDWAPHASMPSMPQCSLDVTTAEGMSDYGKPSSPHQCEACRSHNCTDENKQLPTTVMWELEPPLAHTNAKEVSFYVNWTDIDQFGCSACDDIGMAHKFKMTFATSAGEDVAANMQSDHHLGFDAWMGPEVMGGPQANTASGGFFGKHVFEVEDTEMPSSSADCSAANPAGRRFAIPGEKRAGETFNCERICKSTHPCNCGRNTGMRCTASVAMSSAQVFRYHISMIERSANGTLDGNHYLGPEWQVTAEDITETSPVKVVGRVILEGNSADAGIREMSSSHEHLGCAHCDLLYESTIVSGPFFTPDSVTGVTTRIKKAIAVPPNMTTETCQRYRISALGGYAVKYETGPGLWPSFQVQDTIYTCPDL